MIKNIIFDFGGVILTEDDNWVKTEEVRELLNATDEQLVNGWMSAWPDGRDGKSDEDKFFKDFLINSIGKYDSDLINKLKSIYKSNAGTLDAFALLSKIKSNYKIFALTNITKTWLSYKRNKFKLDNYFDLIVSSCDEGVAKPRPEIFKSLISKAKIIPEESIFVDNMLKNIQPAIDLGFNTILFENIDQLKNEFDKFDIKYDQI